MKIAYVFTQFPAKSETFALTDIGSVRRLGHQVTVYSMRRPVQENAKKEDQRQAPAVRYSSLLFACAFIPFYFKLLLRSLPWIFKESSSIGELLKSVYVCISSLSIIARLKRDAPDVVHLFWGHYPAIVGFMIKSELDGTPVTMFLGAYDLEKNLGTTKSFLSMADAIFTHTYENVQRIKRLRGCGGAKVNVVHRGVDLSGLERYTTAGRKRLSFVSAGRLTRCKGVFEALQNFKLILEKYPESFLDVFGDGPEKARIEDTILGLGLESSVAMHGHQAQDTIFNALSKASFLLCLTSCKGERLPNIVKEAMFLGAVPITTRTPGIQELVRDGVNGVLVEKDLGSAARAITQLIENDRALAGMRCEGRKTIVDSFSGDVSMRKYEKVWHELVGGGGK
ncbi:glycosyltransferase [Aquisalimonas sp. APHAB1-3]|uniref:glycosyltransferase n=1 Tax=Aquisalimonas sp. APHAB1-3 TaxID=3402080 RepID=UPI003AABCF12